jgi:trans-AT polyketide synthase, acyltransferase and oxidoreductase domains
VPSPVSQIQPRVTVDAEALGSMAFRRGHNTRYAYVAGAMAKGISSAALVIRLGKARLLSFYGSGGQRLDVLESAIRQIRENLAPTDPFGVNFIHNIVLPEVEEQTVDLFFRHNVREVEAAAFVHVTPALVRYRVKGLHRLLSGEVIIPNCVIGKASRPEVARQFLSPPPAAMLDDLLRAGKITNLEAELALSIPMAGDLCAEADSAGHTDRRPASTLIPAFLRLRDDAQSRYHYVCKPRIGAAGGLGTPDAIAGAFMMGVDFVLTGSVNQCTVEAATSDLAKDLLAAADVQDMDLTPASDMFEIGGKVQVLKKGVLFPGRANKLYDLYRRHESLEQIDLSTRRMIEEKYFHRTFDAVWEETKSYYGRVAPSYIAGAEENPKQKMALLFRWYLIHTSRLAMEGKEAGRLDYQIHCGPAMGAFNQWVRGTRLEDWRNRHVDEIAVMLMQGAAALFEQRLNQFIPGQQDNR